MREIMRSQLDESFEEKAMSTGREELFGIDDDVKIRTLQMVMATVEREFRAAAGRPPKADDVLDFYALAIGALLDADTHLRTDEDSELGASTAASHINPCRPSNVPASR